MATALIIDRSPLSGLGLKSALENAGHSVQGVAHNGLDALDLAARQPAGLIVLDLDIPKLGGLDLIKRLHARLPTTPLLVFTAFPGEVYEPLCIEAGASGFIARDDSLDTFMDAVKKVLAGKTWFRARALHGHPATQDAAPGEQLTAREITVLHYLAEGYRVKQIADELAISDRTVSTYKSRLLEKTGTHSLVDLLQVASRRGFLEASANTPAAGAGQFNTLLDKVPFPVSLRAPDGRILVANQAFLDLIGLSMDQVIDTRLRDVGIIDLEHLDYAYKTFHAAVEQRIPYMLVVAVQLHGERRIFKNSGHPVLAADGELLGMLSTSVDIGEEQRQIETLREQLARLTFLRSRRGRYLLQHGQQVGSCLEQARQLLERPGEVDRHALLAVLEQVAASVAQVCEAVRLELGEVSLQPGTEDLNALTALALQDSPVTFEVLFTPAANAAHAWVDATRYAGLLQSLLLHLQAQRARRLTIEAHAFEGDPGQLDWTLQLQAAVAPTPFSAAPIIHLALASKLCALFQGHLKVTRDDHTRFQATLQLRLPTAARGR